MKAKRILSALLALVMLLSLAACSGKTETNTPAANAPAAGTSSGSSDTPNEESPSVEDSAFYGPIYDEWSDMTDEELYQLALEEVKDGSEITVYANQPAGSETLVSLQAGKSDFLSKQIGLAHYEINQKVFVQIPPEKINIYDAKSTRLIKRAR